MALLPAALLIELDPATVVAIGRLIAAPLLLLLLVSILTFLITRQGRNEAEDWASLLAVVGWTLWISLDRCYDLQGVAQDTGIRSDLAFMLFGIAPGMAAVIACWSIGYRATAPVAPLGQFFLAQFERYVAILCVPFAFSTVGYPPPSQRMPHYFLAFCAFGIAGWILHRRTRLHLTSTEPLTHGVIYRRAHHLAQRAEAKLGTIRIVTDEHPESANAYAIWPDRISISAELVAQLPPEQLDSILVHEIAHLRHRDALRLAAASLVLVTIAFFILAPALGFFLHRAWNAPVQAAFLLLGLTYFWRQAEYRADALSSDLISPETEVRALLNHRRLAGTPLTQHPLLEAVATHPSALHRIQAVAQRHSRSSDWLRTLLLEGGSSHELEALADVHRAPAIRVPSAG